MSAAGGSKHERAQDEAAWALTLACGHTVKRYTEKAPRRAHCAAPAKSKGNTDATPRRALNAHAAYVRLLELLRQHGGNQRALSRTLGVTAQAVNDQLIRGRKREEKLRSMGLV